MLDSLARDALLKAALLLVFDHVRQIVLPAHTLDLDTGQILAAANAHQHNIVLLQIMPDTGNVRDELLAGRQPHQHTLSVGRVWLFRLLDQRLEDDTLGERFPVQRLARRTDLEVWPRTVHLVERRHCTALQER